MTQLELMKRQVVDSGRWPPEWMVRNTANAVVELAEELAILSARLELAQRYILRHHASARRAIVSINRRMVGMRDRLPLMLG